MYITVLCKVVDNFGDIGTAWRLCRRLAKIQSKYKICLVVDDFKAFKVIASKAKQSTIIDGIEIYDWNNASLCHQIFSQNNGERLEIILELFQCGRPDWMERILFEEKLDRTVQIIMIDYLTAEKYAEDFHCLQSLTRSAKVQKVNFMPGFTERTGGLIIDEEWEDLPPYNIDGPVLEFTYTTKRAYLDNKKLPYMPQTEWDKMMKQCRVLFIRGEESMSRACLSGIPFIWQAYPQSQEYQLVKVRALLDRMRPHFAQEDFAVVENAWLYINGGGLSKAPFEKFLSSLKILRPGFVSFAQSLRKNGDLCSNLMTFINKIAIM